MTVKKEKNSKVIKIEKRFQNMQQAKQTDNIHGNMTTKNNKSLNSIAKIEIKSKYTFLRYHFQSI